MAQSAGGLTVGGDVELALNNVGVPSYVLDTTGNIRWINPAAERLIGDVRGRHFTSVVAPEDNRRARELFARKVLGTDQSTDEIVGLVSTVGTRVAVEISSVPLMSGDLELPHPPFDLGGHIEDGNQVGGHRRGHGSQAPGRNWLDGAGAKLLIEWALR
jgi:PAS domain S-box-containing protein